MPPPTQTQTQTKAQPAKSTISMHQGKWIPISEQMFCNPAWSDAPTNAWRVHAWLTNRMTGSVGVHPSDTVYGTDRTIYGVVKGGATVSYNDIATDIHVCRETVRRCLTWLVEHVLITRYSRNPRGEAYRYHVVNSIRNFPPLKIVDYLYDAPDEEVVEFIDEDDYNSTSGSDFDIEGDDDELA